MLGINENRIALRELIVIDQNYICNFFGIRKILGNLDDDLEIRKLERILLLSIKYIADIHNKYMFHGDIKPANIFFVNNYNLLVS